MNFVKEIKELQAKITSEEEKFLILSKNFVNLRQDPIGVMLDISNLDTEYSESLSDSITAQESENAKARGVDLAEIEILKMITGLNKSIASYRDELRGKLNDSVDSVSEDMKRVTKHRVLSDIPLVNQRLISLPYIEAFKLSMTAKEMEVELGVFNPKVLVVELLAALENTNLSISNSIDGVYELLKVNNKLLGSYFETTKTAVKGLELGKAYKDVILDLPIVKTAIIETISGEYFVKSETKPPVFERDSDDFYVLKTDVNTNSAGVNLVMETGDDIVDTASHLSSVIVENQSMLKAVISLLDESKNTLFENISKNMEKLKDGDIEHDEARVFLLGYELAYSDSRMISNEYLTTIVSNMLSTHYLIDNLDKVFTSYHQLVKKTIKV